MSRHFFSFILTTALFAAVFTSCDQEVTTGEDPTGQVAVNLHADINPVSTYMANNQWEASDKVGLYMKKTGQTLTAIGAVYNDAANVQMSIVGQTLTSTPPVMYPTSGNVDFVAYYPYTASVNPDFTIPVSIAGQEAGLPVEILYSNNITNQAPTASPVTLNFKYSLAKIELTVTNGSNSAFDATDFAAATVTIEGLYTQAKLQLAGGTFTQHQGKQPVTLLRKSANATSATFEALVLPTSEEITFLFDVGGEVYRHKITVNYASETLYKYNFSLDSPNTPVGTATLQNAVIIPRGETSQQNISVVPERTPVYVSISFHIDRRAKTYAGTEEIIASPQETAITNAGMYLYKFDGVSTQPEAYVYIPTIAPNLKITMKATSGYKKIFIAANTIEGSGFLVPTSFSGGFDINGTYTNLNNPLFTTGAAVTNWSTTPLPATIATKADGLIRALARGDIQGTQAGTYSGSNTMLMTNWDGEDDNYTMPPFYSNCIYTLTADVDSVASADATGSVTDRAAKNQFTINLQRAYAKVLLRITTLTGNGTFTNDGTYANTLYVGGQSNDYEGLFQPWAGATTSEIVWSLGNIPKETRPFQQFIGGSVRDHNYLAVDDSIHQFAKWVTRYDNTRVFPTSMTSYPHPGNTVTAVKGVMRTTGNYVALSGTPPVYNFAYTLENARMNPVTHDFGTYAIVGGRYNPKKVVTNIIRAALTSNPPQLVYNNIGTAPAPGVNTDGADYGITIPANDTLYYIPSDGIFILGKRNLLAFYAWVKEMAPACPQNGVAGGTTEDFTPVLATVNGWLTGSDKRIMAYYGGQCFYRIFISDPGTGVTEVNAVLRNHIYAIDITRIKGPGIDDPNNILIPGRPIEELDTYVTASITPLNWHVVD